jgi:MFS family permease
MLLCNVDRSLLSTAVVHIAAELRLDSLACGVLQSAYLWGYGLGQLPSGLAADRFGGPNTLLAGLALWSLATAALPAAAASPAPFAALLAARALFGLGSAAALPATSASVAQLVPPERRAGALSTVYALFNVGSVLGLSSSGPLTHALGGWQGAFWAFGAVGLGWATVGSRLLRAAPRDGRVAVPTRPPRRAVRLRSGGAVQLAALLWCHRCALPGSGSQPAREL